MNTPDRQRLTAEKDAIEQRLAAAKGAEAETLAAQFSERLSQLKARLEPEETPAVES